MAGLHFDSTFNSEPVTKALDKIQKGIYETAKAAELSGGRIDAAFNRISLKGIERIYELMQSFPKEVQGIESFKKQMADLEKRLEQANKKIIELQNQAKQPITVRTNTSEVAKETSAYDSLLESLNDILGARGQNIAAILREQNAIRINQQELKVLEEIENKGLKLSESQQTRRVQLTNSVMQHKQAILSLQQVVSNEIKLEEAAKGSMDEMSQSLGRMRMAYRQLTEEGRNSKFGQDLLIGIQEADSKIKQLDSTIGNHQRNIGDYGNQWNGLNMSIQQVGRELPSLANGAKTFFSAISNNLPILADELKRAKVEFNALKAEGKDATPVWKQVTSSLFSWNTALTVGITLLTLYGDKIVDLVAGLFDAKDATKELLSAEQEMALARKKAVSDSTKERTELDLLYNKLKSTTTSIKERNAAVNEWMKKYPQHSNILNGELISLSKLESAYQSLSKQIIESAKARAYSDKITELTKRRDDAEFRRLNSLNSLEKSKDALAKNNSDLQRTITYNAQKQYDAIVQEVANYDSKIESIGKNIKLDNLFPQPEKGTYDYWQQQVQIAESALKQIDSKQKELMDAGKFDGIDANIVSNYKAQSKLLEEAQKELKVYDTTGKYDKQEESASEKLRKEQEKSAGELLSLRRQNQQDEINLMKEGSDKKLKQIELDYQKELDAIKKQESDWSKAQKGKLTQEQTVEISTRYTNAESKKEKGIVDNAKERLIAEQQALNEYLTKYGTFQQQKLAISQEYAEKIKKAQEESGINSTQVKLLQREQHEKTSAIDVASIKANMDWVAVFGEFGGMFSDMIKPALEDAKKYIKTDEFKNSDQSDQKALIDAINQMEKSLGGSGGLNFKKLGQDVQIYQNSLRDLNAAKEEEIDAINKLKKAQEDYEKTIKGGTEQEKQTAKDALDNAQINADTASANVKAQTNIVNQNQQGLSDTATNLKANMNNVAEGLSKLASGGIKSAYDGIIQAGKGMGGSIEKVAKSLEDVPIIGWIISIIDVLKDGLSNLVGGLLDAIFNAVSGIISDVLSGDLFVTIGESLATGISKILDAITFGGFGSWTNAGESDETLKDDIELLSKSNEDLKAAIDNLAEKMDSASVADATDLYNQQKENLHKQMTNTQEMMQRSGAAYSNGWIGIGGSHSSNAKINSSMSSDDWSRISGVIGRTINNAGDFWNLTSEQMAKVAMDATDLYTKIKSHADDGYEDAGQYMDSYIKYYKQLEELENTWREKLTSSSFDTIRDDFKSALMDMEADTEDFAANFEELMKNAIFESLMTKKYDALLQSWYKDFASAMDGGELTEDEQRNLKKSWEDIVNQGIAERDALYDTMGWDKTTSSSTSQDSTKGGFDTMSQDTGEELNGRFTALQISNEEIKNSMLSMLAGVNLISAMTTSNGITLMEIRNVALMSNSHLQDIAKYTKELIGFKQTISNIENSAKAMAGK